ncbi:diphthamide biosynthesis protein [Rutstroemia sp. NJR-2017a BBW]|nr:diphthamide biosynthesis protein [Rutstroemia sp. NJR-2017a BBW]
MLPPIEEAILHSNPKFKKLHERLSAEILNPDGSTKNHPAQKERDAVAASLKAARIEAAKSRILIDSLSSLDISPAASKPASRTSQAPSQKVLPPEVIELIILLTTQLSLPSISKQSITLLTSTPQYHTLQTHLPLISTLLSTHLHSSALSLARIQNPTTNPSFLHRHLPTLLPTTITLLTTNTNKAHSLTHSRVLLTNQTIHVLDLYHTLHRSIIQHLERQKHGPLSRHSVSKISHLSLSAQTLALELKERYLRGEKIIYDERTSAALGNYMRELKNGRERLKERERGLRRELWGYGVGREGDGGKEKVMREIARVYAELKVEVEDVGRDVEKLRGR